MTTPTARFEHLLSSRARIGWGAPGAAARPVASPRYEFGGGYPDPASFPYDDMVEATARMMKAEGAQALTYGDPQGYRGLRELVCHKYRVFEGLEVTPENIFVANGSGHALSLAFSAFVDPGDPIICEAPTFSGSLNNIRRHGPEILDAPVDAAGLRAGPRRARDPGRHALEDPRRGRAARLALRAARDAAGLPGLQLRRRREPLHVTGRDLVSARPHGIAREALDRRLSRKARRDAPGALGGARVHRRRDQPPRGRILYLDQAPGRDRLCAIGGVGGGGAGSGHAGARVLPERRWRALHPPGLHLRADGDVLRGRSAHRARDPRRAAVTPAPRRALQTERLRCPSVGSRSASCCGPRPVHATRKTPSGPWSLERAGSRIAPWRAPMTAVCPTLAAADGLRPRLLSGLCGAASDRA